MNESIGTRELFVLDQSDVVVCGTYHKAYVAESAVQTDLAAGHHLGVVFLNSTSPTRAANGDAAVYLAECFAKYGFPSFRLDLPGFGDSAGDHPEDLLGFICRGGYAAIATSKIRELATKYNLSGVVIAGHCAGSVSALFAAANCGECRGLVLIGPFFHLTQPITLSRVRKKITLGERQSWLSKWFRGASGFLKRIPVLRLGRGLPQNANIPLLLCWKKLASEGLPILFLKGPERKTSSAKARLKEFDYLNYLLRVAGRRHQVVVEVIDGAGNAFANRQGREAVRQHTERWLNTYFSWTQGHERVDSTAVVNRLKTVTPQHSRAV